MNQLSPSGGVRRRLLGPVVALVVLFSNAYAVVGQSGHHFASGSQRDNAFIGIDFGRNSFGGRSVSFRTNGGRSRLRTAMALAVGAGERRMSFDFGFDFRSVIQRDADGYRLDDDVMPSIAAFLAEVDAADALAQENGRRFSVDVVLMDYRVADGVASETDVGSGDVVNIGEFPEFLTSAPERSRLLSALAPTLKMFGQHPRVTLNLMNEPEFISLPRSEVQARIRAGLWVSASVEDGPARKTAGDLDGHPPSNSTPWVTVHRDPIAGKIILSQSDIPPDAAISLLSDLRRAVDEAAPSARVTVGWADDLSALAQTARLEDTGVLVTDVVSFHVYPAFGKGLTLDRSSFTAALGDRPVRITEWGLGRPADLVASLADALTLAGSAGFDGVIFWWDNAHSYAHDAFRSAVAAVGEPISRSADFDRDGRVDFDDFLLFAARFGSSPGDGRYVSQFDLDLDGGIRFSDFLLFAAAFGH